MCWQYSKGKLAKAKVSHPQLPSMLPSMFLQDQELYDQLPEPDDDENDMLDLAYGLTET
jgi:hypothetical protein